MSLIDLTLNEPALKRTEVVDSTTEAGTPTTGEAATDAVDEATAASSKSTGRLRRTVRNAGLLGVGVVGVLALRKFRPGRTNKNKDEIVTEIETEAVPDSDAQ